MSERPFYPLGEKGEKSLFCAFGRFFRFIGPRETKEQKKEEEEEEERMTEEGGGDGGGGEVLKRPFQASKERAPSGKEEICTPLPHQ